MGKASIDLPDGTKIVIEGSTDEVAKIVSLYQGNTGRPSKRKAKAAPAKQAEPSIRDHVLELREKGFFKDKRSLASVQEALETKGHKYKVTSLSGPMRDLVRDEELERVKEERNYVYYHKQ